jgi:hypothetical protein
MDAVRQGCAELRNGGGGHAERHASGGMKRNPHFPMFPCWIIYRPPSTGRATTKQEPIQTNLLPILD